VRQLTEIIHQGTVAPRAARLGAPIAFAPFPLSLPSSLVSFDGCRFAASALDTRVEIAKKDVRPLFSKAHLGRF
jgi:hypothetical protein